MMWHPTKDRIPMRWPVAFLLAWGLLAAGCHHTKRDLVESELRHREGDVHELKAEVSRLHGYNDGLQRELQAVRQSSSAKITPELASQTYTLKSIVLARQTGGYDNDGIPGDEALQVVLEPQDPDDQAIKAPGTLDVQALEFTPEGLKRPLSAWHVPPEQLRPTWRSGLFATGYFLVLPWKNQPTSERVRVVAQFTLADGRVFEADKDVVIHPQQTGDHRPPPLPVIEGPVGPSLEPETPLPPPRKVEPVPPDGAAPAALWHTEPAPSLHTAVHILRPVPIK
jgi:hypothetical protein